MNLIYRFKLVIYTTINKFNKLKLFFNDLFRLLEIKFNFSFK